MWLVFSHEGLFLPFATQNIVHLWALSRIAWWKLLDPIFIIATAKIKIESLGDYDKNSKSIHCRSIFAMVASRILFK